MAIVRRRNAGHAVVAWREKEKWEKGRRGHVRGFLSAWQARAPDRFAGGFQRFRRESGLDERYRPSYPPFAFALKATCSLYPFQVDCPWDAAVSLPQSFRESLRVTVFGTNKRIHSNVTVDEYIYSWAKSCYKGQEGGGKGSPGRIDIGRQGQGHVREWLRGFFRL